MQVAAYVFDNADPPPALVQAFDFHTYAVNLLQVPAGMLASVKHAYNAWAALDGYKSSVPHAVEWTKRNQNAYKFVASVLAERKRIKSLNG